MRTYRKTTIGAAILILLFLASYFYPLYGPEDFNKQTIIMDEKSKVIGRAPFPPSLEHIIGTDRNGADMHLLLLYGAKYTLITALVVAFLRVLFGGLMGVFLSLYAPLLKKYFKDFFIIFRYIPTVLLGIVVMLPVHGMFEKPVSSVIAYQILMLVFLGFPSATIFASELTDELTKTSFIRSSYLMGANKFHIIKRHLMPYFKSYGVLFTIQQLLSTLQLTMHLGIFGYFLGGQTVGGIFGYDDPPKPASLSNEWAGLIGQNLNDFIQAPWIIFGPIFGFLFVILIVNMMKKELEENLNGALFIKKKKEKSESTISISSQPLMEQFVFVESDELLKGAAHAEKVRPQKKFIGKKALVVALAVMLLVVMVVYNPGRRTSNTESAAENNEKKPSQLVYNNVPNAQTASDPMEQRPHAVGEEIEISGSTLTVRKVEKSEGNATEKPRAGSEFIIVTVQLKNTGKEPMRYDPALFDVLDNKGNSYPQPFIMIDIDTTLPSGDLAAGESITGTLAFEMPKDVKLKLRYYPFHAVDEYVVNL
ncbi:DUF4352 domain-containing protein [Paenibacillus sp. BSR1-1]|uniref:DUF4352 domain-containing protein n=1 Tax=Paenibacillus sp. BSR1-1 TaxID=3020845 RepID=UPI0025B04441|nr:DUF4352 domain-containing protein [Paenibacillus sp. BSR1-1]MDN3017193.1 DUF4352 domain-containing protein [Paenibacillus sp. BSR1-1]